MPTPEQSRLYPPHFNPRSETEHEANVRTFERTFNTLPFFSPFIVREDGTLTWTSGATTYTDMGGADAVQMTIQKLEDWTDLIVDVACSCYKFTNAGVVEIGVQIDTTDTDVTRVMLNTTSEQKGTSGFVRVEDVRAGNRLVTLRARIGSGAGSMDMDVNDYAMVRVLEVPPLP